jgi:two-component system, OmpR family, response regulator
MSKTKIGEKKARKILIVEDEGDMCLLLEILLNGKELKADHVKTLAAAEEYLQTEQSELVVLDNRLPDGLGLDFIEFLKSKYPSIKIILISGVDAAAEDIALQNGADCFLKKPFSRTQLYESIHSLLN